MTAQEALSKIKELFADPQAVNDMAAPSATPTESVKEYALKDGSKVLIDKLEVGGKVQITDASGNAVDAPAGDYVMADDTVVSVDETSTIVSVTPPAAAAPEMPPAEAPTGMIEQKITNLQAELETLKNELKQQMVSGFTKQQTELEVKFENQQKMINGLKDVLVGLINLPSEKPTTVSQNSFNKHVESKQDKIARYLEFVKNIK